MKQMARSLKHNAYKHHREYKHYGLFYPDDVLRKVSPSTDTKDLEINNIKHRVNFKSLRLQCFKRSRVCIKCGKIGTIMSLDKFRKESKLPHAHFNLYAEGPEGILTIMTKDHIIPKSKGGKDHLSNLQTMCIVCNMKKDDKIEEMETQNGKRQKELSKL